MIGVKLIIGLLVVCIVIATSTGKCLQKSTKHCSCEVVASIFRIRCTIVNSMDQLLEIGDFNDLPVRLTIHNLNMTTIPSNYFKDIKLTYFVVSRSRVEVIEPNAFAGSENSLKQISCYDCGNLKQIADISRFNNVREIWLAGASKLYNGRLDCRTLDKLPASPAQMVFYDLNITSVDLDCFKRFTSLEYLVLKQNHLKSFIGDTLPIMSTLELSENDFDHIPTKVLTSLVNGAVIYLHYNKITNIRREEYLPLIKNNYYVYLGGNPIECGCVMAWLPKFIEKDQNSFSRSKILQEHLICQGDNKRKGKEVYYLKDEDYSECL